MAYRATPAAIDVAARVIAFRVRSSMMIDPKIDADSFARAKIGFVLDALEQALHEYRPIGGLIHHSDRGVQYVSIKYTDRLA